MQGYDTQYGQNPLNDKQLYGTDNAGYVGYPGQGAPPPSYAAATGQAPPSGPPPPPPGYTQQSEEQRKLWKQEKGYRECSLIMFMLLLACIGMLIAFGIVYAAPYFKAVKFTEANCTVNVAKFNGLEKDCSCGKNCGSSFPCTSILVTLEDVPEAVPQTLLAVKHNNLGSRCSIHPSCDRSREKNEDRVEDKLEEYAKNDTFISCFYNPNNVQEIFEVLAFNEVQISMFLAGPAIGIVLFFGALVLIFLEAKTVTKMLPLCVQSSMCGRDLSHLQRPPCKKAARITP